MNGLDSPVDCLDGIGKQRSEMLSSCGIRTVSDLLSHIPFRYEDRTRFRAISSIRENEWVLVCGDIGSAGYVRTRRKGFSIFEILVRDHSGGIRVKFFNQPYAGRVYSEGIRLVIYGQAKQDAYSQNALFIANPECEILDEDNSRQSVHSGRIVPIYRKLGDLQGRLLRKIMHAAASSVPPEIPDAIPAYLSKRLRLPSKAKSLGQLHFPRLRGSGPKARERELALLNACRSPEHKRFIFEELFEFEVGIRMVRRHRRRIGKERAYLLDERVRGAIRKVLPFHPTGAQKEALKEIAEDMRGKRPMGRLLQGDVGSGKTIVAAQAAIIAVENGYQAAMMAPTEILAEQHYFFMKRLFAPLGYGIELLKGSMGSGEKRRAQERIASGVAGIAIGTHALIQKEVQFKSLALVIIDEQHRFGVEQRHALRGKGNQPDVLVMTATPIPRSLALTLYGDLDVSTIREMPPGRKPVRTILDRDSDRAGVYDAVRRTVKGGNQVYIVYPLVEESEKSDLKAATEAAAHLEAEVFPGFRVGLLHGRMKGEKKEEVMRAFSSGSIDILVSTTVIEVGVDVPNATLMVIEHAERFGLAQLHQLRGRIGRGPDPSTCILIGKAGENPQAHRRLEIMCETNDGFRIAEVDLALRGQGDVLGTRQAGLPVFQFADIIRDGVALELACREAEKFLQLLDIRPDRECRRAALLIRQRWQARSGETME